MEQRHRDRSDLTLADGLVNLRGFAFWAHLYNDPAEFSRGLASLLGNTITNASLNRRNSL